MPDATSELLYVLRSALAGFQNRILEDAATHFFSALGYRSDDYVEDFSHDPRAFIAELPNSERLNQLQRVDDWRRCAFLFQIQDHEVRLLGADSAGHGQTASLIHARYARKAIEYFVFLAIELTGENWSRTELAAITREINRPFEMPAIVLFKYGQYVSLAVIDRRLHLRDATQEVMNRRITVIKDVRYADPHRAHLDILAGLAFENLGERHAPTNFRELYNAWIAALSIQILNKRFFVEIRNWFYWARVCVKFPDGAQKDIENRDSEALLRLLTRLVFCWFLTEKKLIPGALFSERTVEKLLRDWQIDACEKDTQSRYYKAILQNLFFATLNTPVAERKFRTVHNFKGRNQHYGDQRYFRHVNLFHETAQVEALYQTIPFLNGGLFEMLDEIPGRDDPDITQEKRVDGFSDVPGKQPLVPDFLFFGNERPVSEIAGLLGEANPPKVRGLFRIFRDYKFTIEENTPFEEDIALDPELLGRVFENLLAAINPETGAVARKSTGSFYTPREIVNYMVEEALVRHLLTVLNGIKSADLEAGLRELVAEGRESHGFNTDQAGLMVDALSRLRILDPACGSGAFPMGLLHRLVHILRKLDPGNERWKAAKLAVLPVEMREKAEQVFREESFDYTRKLELIKDCIHGVDIQPAAIQISKLRFFLSLVIEQKSNTQIRPLPNLETKFVCTNALLGLPSREGLALFAQEIVPKEQAILDVRIRHFSSATHKDKATCHADDRQLRRGLGAFIKDIGGSGADELASAVVDWDPYKPDRVANYFDPESMFGIREGFDITIGNPPYVRADEQSEWNRRQREQIQASKNYETLWEKWDLFVPFIERAYQLLKPSGISTMIVSDAFCHSKYAQKPQNWFLKNSRILRLDFCSNLQIFEAAVHNLIYFFQKANGTNHQPERRVHQAAFGQVELLPTDEQVNLTYRAFFPEDETSIIFACNHVPIDSICYVSYGLRPSSAPQFEKFVTENLVSKFKTAIHSKRYVEGKHLNNWIIDEFMWLEWGTKRAPDQFYAKTFNELYEVSEKIIAKRSPGSQPVSVYDDGHIIFTPSSVGFVPWYLLSGVRNNSINKVARYRGEKPTRLDLPKREELEATSRRFNVKYLLGVMNSSTARDFLRANRRSNIHLYPDDWKKLPIPDVSPEQQAPIVALVDEILTLRRANPRADIAQLEAEIDQKVAALYGLAADGMAIYLALP